MSQNISYICKMKKKDIYYGILIYIAIAGISFLLAPLLTYVLFVSVFFLALIGCIVDMILSLLFWWVGYDGNVGSSILELTGAMPSHTTTWLIFMAIVTIIFVTMFFGCAYNDINSPFKHKKISIKNKSGNTFKIDLVSDFHHLIKDIEDDYWNDKINKKTANKLIKRRFKKWIVKKCDITNNEAESIWKSKKELMEID